MIDSPQQQAFGEDKFKQLPAQCRSLQRVKSVLGRLPETPLYARCQRQTRAELFVPGISVISAIYRHILKAMADLLAHGRPASDIMQAHLMVVNK